MNTTLKKISQTTRIYWDFNWEMLLKALDKTRYEGERDEAIIEIKTIYELVGFDIAICALETVEGYEKEMRLFAVFCARQVQHLMTHEQYDKLIDVGERYANGEDVETELEEAYHKLKGHIRVLADEVAEALVYEFVHEAVYDAAIIALIVAKDYETDKGYNQIKTAIHDEFKKLISL
jgi:hypothetical protein